jgi:hypothetical protein
MANAWVLAQSSIRVTHGGRTESKLPQSHTARARLMKKRSHLTRSSPLAACTEHAGVRYHTSRLTQAQPASGGSSQSKSLAERAL